MMASRPSDRSSKSWPDVPENDRKIDLRYADKIMTSPAGSTRKFCGMFTRRERWGLSLRGWLVSAAFASLAAALWLLNVQQFLAQTKRLDASILVVEGWINPPAIKAAVAEFQAGHYEKIYTTGGPVAGVGGYINDYNTSASVAAQLLVKAGIQAGLVQMVPSHVSGRDRTYSSALALREYFQTNGVTVKSFNVLTLDVHARRTRLLFQEAFGRETTVGIIAVADPDYDPHHWWRYSEGVREVLGESIAYIYAKFLFWPDKTKS
jgi:uncharacterized SAM-binding protein YcdF (DUF218 family)